MAMGIDPPTDRAEYHRVFREREDLLIHMRAMSAELVAGGCGSPWDGGSEIAFEHLRKALAPYGGVPGANTP